MRIVYENPPLIEAFCGLTFDPSEASDQTVPGLLYERIKSVLPVKRGEAVAGAVPKSDSANSEIQFATPDGSLALRLIKDQFTFHTLPAYCGWATYRENLLRVLSAYVEVARPTAINASSLIYINRIGIPRSPEDSAPTIVGRYISAFPVFPEWILKGGRYSAFNQWVQTSFEEGTLRLSTSTAAFDQIKESGAFIVQIEFAMLPDVRIAHEHFGIWLEEAHHKIEETFLACLTPESEALFGKKSYA